MKTITRKEAKFQGLKRYFTNKPCKYNHIAERFVSSGRCSKCDEELQKTQEYRAKRREYEQTSEMKIKRAIYNKTENRKKSLSEMQKRSYRKNKQAFLYRLLVSRIPSKIRKGISGCSTEEKLGYTIEEFKNHIELLFQDGMTWENHGEWHIDHIMPVSKITVNSHEDAKIINQLSNLQPLWAKDNLSKGDRINWLL